LADWRQTAIKSSHHGFDFAEPVLEIGGQHRPYTRNHGTPATAVPAEAGLSLYAYIT
jgi:hypothetical protein